MQLLYKIAFLFLVLTSWNEYFEKTATSNIIQYFEFTK